MRLRQSDNDELVIAEFMKENHKQVEKAVMNATMSLIYQETTNAEFMPFLAHCCESLGAWMATVGTDDDMPFLNGLRERFKICASIVPPFVVEYLLTTLSYGDCMRKLLSG